MDEHTTSELAYKRGYEAALAKVEKYLVRKLEEWDALGDRKWDPRNAWGYNFIMACLDDLSDHRERR